MGPMLDIHSLCLLFFGVNVLFLTAIWDYLWKSFILSLKKKKDLRSQKSKDAIFQGGVWWPDDQTYSVSSGLSLTLVIILRQKPDHSNLQQYS